MRQIHGLVMFKLMGGLLLIRSSAIHLYFRLPIEESYNVSTKGRAISGTTIHANTVFNAHFNVSITT